MALVSQNVVAISRSANPKLDIINAVGDLSQVHVLGDLVLMGIYIRPEKTAGGIIRPSENVDEDQYQGKVGLVLKTGPIAYAEWEQGDDMGQYARAGDWVVADIKNGLNLALNAYPCRLVPYKFLRMNIPDPIKVF